MISAKDAAGLWQPRVRPPGTSARTALDVATWKKIMAPVLTPRIKLLLNRPKMVPFDLPTCPFLPPGPGRPHLGQPRAQPCGTDLRLFRWQVGGARK